MCECFVLCFLGVESVDFDYIFFGLFCLFKLYELWGMLLCMVVYVVMVCISFFF